MNGPLRLALRCGALVLLVGSAAGFRLSAEEPPAAKIDFQKDVAPILRQQCLDCHGPEMQMAELRLDARRFVLGDEADPDLVKPGKSAESLLIKRLTDAKLGVIMPPLFPFFPTDKPGLPEAAINILKNWIDQGAPWPEGAVLATAAAAEEESAATKAMFAAIRSGNHELVTSLLAQNRDPTSARNKQGDTPLAYAATFADQRVVELLLEAGADVNAADREGATPLIRAAGDFGKVQMLLERGAKVDARSNFGRTPVLVAAAYPGNLRTVELLLERGAKIADRDQAGETCLTSAAKRGDVAMVKYLLKHGAEGGAVSILGRSPVVWAAEEGNVETLACLLEHGAEKAQPQLDYGLAMAAGRGPTTAVRLLLDHGANVNAPSFFAGYTPLMWAAYSENVSTDALQLLLDRGADRAAKAANGETALSLAQKRGKTLVARLLEPATADEARPTATTAAPGEPPAASTEQIKAAAEKSLALLQLSGPTFYARSGCLACHHHSVTSLAAAEARLHGLPVDEPTARQLVQLMTMDMQRHYRKLFVQRIDHPAGSATSAGYLLLGMAAEGYAADDVTDAMAFEVAGRQHQDGSWTAFSHRPPLEYSRITGTALALHALDLYAPPALRDDYRRRINRARDWLRAAQPSNNAEHGFRALGLSWAGADKEEGQADVAALLKAQNADGGWSQFPTLESDAYATGLVLWTLSKTGHLAPSDATYQRAVSWLVRNQQGDGSWHVRTRSFPIQPYFESGFPHGPDQWISATASGFATAALIRALPR